MGEHPPRATNEEIAVDCKLQVAHLLLRSRCLLEPRRSRSIWFSHQSTHLPLLRAGTQSNPGSWPHGSVRRIWKAWLGPRSVLPARAQARTQMEGRSAEAFVLVPQPGSDLHGH